MGYNDALLHFVPLPAQWGILQFLDRCDIKSLEATCRSFRNQIRYLQFNVIHYRRRKIFDLSQLNNYCPHCRSGFTIHIHGDLFFYWTCAQSEKNIVNWFHLKDPPEERKKGRINILIENHFCNYRVINDRILVIVSKLANVYFDVINQKELFRIRLYNEGDEMGHLAYYYMIRSTPLLHVLPNGEFTLYDTTKALTDSDGVNWIAQIHLKSLKRSPKGVYLLPQYSLTSRASSILTQSGGYIQVKSRELIRNDYLVIWAKKVGYRDQKVFKIYIYDLKSRQLPDDCPVLIKVIYQDPVIDKLVRFQEKQNIPSKVFESILLDFLSKDLKTIEDFGVFSNKLDNLIAQWNRYSLTARNKIRQLSKLNETDKNDNQNSSSSPNIIRSIKRYDNKFMYKVCLGDINDLGILMAGYIYLVELISNYR